MKFCPVTKKERYFTVEAVERQLRWLAGITGRKGRVYACRYCNAFHVTSQHAKRN